MSFLSTTLWASMKLRAGVNAPRVEILADVCRILDLDNPAYVSRRLEADGKMTIVLNYGQTRGKRGGPRRWIVVNEPGLYRLIFRSDKPEAKAFQRWVFHGVFPANPHGD